jgi:hypothetical protein
MLTSCTEPANCRWQIHAIRVVGGEDHRVGAARGELYCDSPSPVGIWLMLQGFWVSDAQCERLAPLLPNKPPGVVHVHGRRVISGIVWPVFNR